MLPDGLTAGDKIAIVSPASKIDPALIDACARAMTREGFIPVVAPHARGESGSYSASAEDRIADFRDALLDDSIRAIVCSRGGYGAVHLLEQLDRLPDACFRKWLVGFSDITALHALFARKGVATLHAAMAKHLGLGHNFACYDAELAFLRGELPSQTFPGHKFNHSGEAEGPVVGGNLAVLGGLIGTTFDPIRPGSILFIEDIAEPIYKVERILWQLRLRGVFSRISGLMVGRFTDYRPSADHPDMETMIHRFLSTLPDFTAPVAFGLPIGHIPDNHPLLLNHPLHLSVTPASTLLRP